MSKLEACVCALGSSKAHLDDRRRDGGLGRAGDHFSRSGRGVAIQHRDAIARGLGTGTLFLWLVLAAAYPAIALRHVRAKKGMRPIDIRVNEARAGVIS